MNYYSFLPKCLKNTKNHKENVRREFIRLDIDKNNIGPVSIK